MVRKFRTKLIASTVAVLSVFNFMMIPVAAAEGEIEVETWAEVLAAVEENDECTIKLTKDIDLSLDDLAIVVDGGKNITLDLNGKTISRDHSARTENGIVDIDVDDVAPVSYFTLKDSSADASGKITGAYSTASLGANSVITYASAGIFVGPYGNFTMEGGTICNNSGYWGRGAGVFVDGGTFTMNGGVISGNNVSRYSNGIDNRLGEGAGVCLIRYEGESIDAKFTMNGGSIKDNGTPNYGEGAVYAGGGVFVGNHCTFTMNGGTISGNSATRGGGVYIEGDSNNSRGVFNLNGGSITGNTGSGIYLASTNSRLVLGGEAVIDVTGNKDASGKDENIYLTANGELIRFSAALKEGSKIGVRSAGTGNDITITSGFNTNNPDAVPKDYFLDDSGNYYIVKNNNEVHYVKCNHNWGDATYEWSDDYSTCTATRVCSRNATHIQTETVNTVSEEITPATCTTAGEMKYTATFTTNSAFKPQETKVETDMLPHTGVHTAAAAATCTEAGNSEYWTCSVCGKYFSDEECTKEIAENSWIIDAIAHKNAEAHAAVAATCDTAGNTAYWSCPDCGKYFSDEECTQEIEKDSWILPAIAHKNAEAHAAVAATCDTAGNTAYWSCPDCGKFFSDEECTKEIEENSWIIPAGHKLTKTEAKDATCTEDGNIEYWTCSECSKYFSDENGTTELTADQLVIKASHKLSKTEKKDETCTEDGNVEYWTCSVCKKHFADEECTTELTDDELVIKASHKLTKTEAKDATCTEDGNIEYWTCSECGKYFADEECTTELTAEQLVIKAGHKLTKTEAKDATCTEDGNVEYWTCSVCNKHFADADCTTELTADDLVIKAAHKPVDVAAKDATCTEAGNEAGKKCSVCGDILDGCKEIPAKGHTWGAWKLTKAATVDEEGEQTRTCSVCKAKETKVVPKLEPTITLKINKTSLNVVCGATDTLKAVLVGATDKITWKSSDAKTAKVDANGKITALKAGTVTITASAAGKTAKCTVTVLYKDVTNTSDFWYTPTNYLTAKGVVKGYANQTEFRPANICTRAQMVTFIWRLMGEPAPKGKTCKFSDVKEKDYFFKACIWGNENHIVEGYNDKTFRPQVTCARKHAVTFLWRLAGKPEPTTKNNKFTDVKEKDYYYKATLWASEKKILEGYNDNTFRPGGDCLRRQMVTFLYKYDKFVTKSK